MNLHWIAWRPVLDTVRHGYGCGYPQSAHPSLARAAIPTPANVRLASKSRLDRRGSNLVKRFSLPCRSASRSPNPPKRAVASSEEKDQREQSRECEGERQIRSDPRDETRSAVAP